MLWRNGLFLVMVLLILLTGCNGIQKLTEKELEEKAKEEFYSLEDADLFGVSFKSSDFVLEKTEVIYPKDFDLYDFDCIDVLSGECLLTEDKFYSLNEQVYIYNFGLKEEVKRDDREMWGKVILRTNGELIANYITGLEHFIE